MNVPDEDTWNVNAENPDCSHDEIEIVEDPACLFVWSVMPDFPLQPQPTVRRCVECGATWIRVSEQQATTVAFMRSLGQPAIRMVAA